MNGSATRFNSNEVTEDFISARRLWTAVLTLALEDWRNGTLRAKREAQQFLFDDNSDFGTVCAGAGIDPDSFRSRLLHIGRKVATENSWLHPLAA